MKTSKLHPCTLVFWSGACIALALCVGMSSLTPLVRAAEQQSGPASGNQGPTLSSSEIAQGAILLHFTNARGGLVLKGAGRGAFEIAGADRQWFPADAHLVNGVIVVSTSLVQQPTVVRYAPKTPTAAVLFDGAGVPAAAFHTTE